jgi:hypothetical protein
MYAPKRINQDYPAGSLDQAGAIWQFHTAKYSIALFAEPEDIDPTDCMDDEDEAKRIRESNNPADWFCAVVAVYGPNGERLGMDILGGCSYSSFKDFYESHRDPNPANRNTLELKAKNTIICHYFPSMVRQAIADARIALS